jgi:hypothetical protein
MIFDADIREGKVTRNPDSVFFPSEAEVEAEAWENYVFDAMVAFDADLMQQLVIFRSSLFVVPPPPGAQDPAQVQAREARTNAFWFGLSPRLLWCNGAGAIA